MYMGCRLSVSVHPEKILKDMISPAPKRKKTVSQNTSPIVINKDLENVDTSTERTTSNSSFETMFIDSF